MTAPRHRSAWIWLAITAIVIASAARAEAGLQSAKALTQPVLSFISGAQEMSSTGSASSHASIRSYSVRESRALHLQGVDGGLWLELLPVLFVGLLSPLSLLSARSAFGIGRTPPAPALPALFQRPPPAQTVASLHSA